jgi:hypothetical protein
VFYAPGFDAEIGTARELINQTHSCLFRNYFSRGVEGKHSFYHSGSWHENNRWLMGHWQTNRLLPSSSFITPQSSSLVIWCSLRVTLSCINWLYTIASILFCKYTKSPHAKTLENSTCAICLDAIKPDQGRALFKAECSRTWILAGQQDYPVCKLLASSPWICTTFLFSRTKHVWFWWDLSTTSSKSSWN